MKEKQKVKINNGSAGSSIIVLDTQAKREKNSNTIIS
jgi:hypothetical protein